MNSLNPLQSTGAAIILGSLVISFAILFSSGVITLNKTPSGNTTVTFNQPRKQITGSAPVPGQPNQPTQGGEVASAKVEVEPLRDNDHVRGDRGARILLIEYSDLECPFCKKFHPTAQQVVKDYNGQVAWVYRHFPLDQLHSKADKEAEAVECANELGRENAFWALTDKIYEVTPANNGLDLDDLPKLASEVGLDLNKFKECLDSGKYADYVEADYQSGIKAGINGTPGNILLDTKTGKTVSIPGAVPIESLKSSIDSLLKV